MRALMVAVLVVSVSGCLTTNIRPTAEEKCARSGMAMGGGLGCEIPKTEADKCGIQPRANLASEIETHNSSLRTKNFVLGMGYLFWVIPGLIGYAVWSGDESDNEQRFIETRSNIATACKQQPESQTAH